MPRRSCEVGWATRALRTGFAQLRRGTQRSGYSRLRICSDRLHAIQLELRAHLLHLRRQLFDCSLLLRDCRLQFCDRLFLHFAGHESRGRPENPFEKARKRIATLGADRRDFDEHIVGQAVAIRIGG